MEHAKLSASGSKKWLHCPQSLALESYFPEETSVYAQEGTTAHTLGDISLQLALGRISKRKHTIEKKKLELNEEMEEYVQGYVDYVVERFNLPSAQTIEIEARLDYSDWAPEGFGTGDVVIVGKGYIEIIDLKYGKGVLVEVKQNSQLMLYALGACAKHQWLYDVETVRLCIYQPRRDHISTWEISVKELLEWGEEVKHKARLALAEEGEAVAGKHCTEGFCKAKSRCKAFAEHALSLGEQNSKHPSLLTDGELEDSFIRGSSLISWVKAVESYMVQEALKGKTYESLKLVEGQSRRVWKGEVDQILTRLTQVGLVEDTVLKKSLMGIADVEKLVGKKVFKEGLSDIWERPPGRPTLVDMEDKRPHYLSPQQAFKDIV